MNDKSGKRYCTIDHANKQADCFDYNPHEFWLRQARRETGKSQQESGQPTTEKVGEPSEFETKR